MSSENTIKSFQAISARLLERHYGIGLEDTRLTEEDYVKVLVDSKAEPYEYINEIAVDFDLDRIDSSSSATISESDQNRVKADIKASRLDNSPSP